MGPERAFLRSLKEAPQGGGPRPVFADWPAGSVASKTEAGRMTTERRPG
jgi:hypothetical protein